MILIANVGLILIFQKMLLPLINNGEKIGSEIIMIFLWGIMPFCLILLIWQNNPIRFFNIVEKYQKRQIKWGKDMRNDNIESTKGRSQNE
ncbi:hypothetical protein [Streptococcus cuniculi]|uniref:hypothetical protein n=1 Tax=Streptococcus cuniculi TaxID=1432788 RepID=UPI00188461D4|nr:hypothetical protein [Streptococcus cuniculi]MBF0777947.1 hypothetical protein [Streptococcus cuniculi]